MRPLRSGSIRMAEAVMNMLNLCNGSARLSCYKHLSNHVMKQIVKSALLILLILTGQILPVSTRITGSVKKNPLVMLGFDRCAGDPCFLGIIPGKTSWLDTSSILLEHGFTKETLYYHKYEPNDPFQTGINISRVLDNPRVTAWVDMYDPHNKYRVTLADVLELYGLPCAVESDYKGSVWFSYPNILVHTLLENELSYTWSAPIEYLHLLDPQMPTSVSGITVCDKIQDTAEY